MKFKPNQLVIKHIFDRGDAIPLHTIAKVVSYDSEEDELEVKCIKPKLRSTYTFGSKWKPYSPKISRTKALL